MRYHNGLTKATLLELVSNYEKLTEALNEEIADLKSTIALKTMASIELEDYLRGAVTVHSGYYTLASSRAKPGDPIWDAILRSKERINEQ